MQRPSRRRPSLPQVDVEPGSPQARNSNSKSDVTAAEPRTPRGTDIIVRKTGGPTDLLDSFLNAFHAAPIGFVFIVVLSFFTRFWQVCELSLLLSPD